MEENTNQKEKKETIDEGQDNSTFNYTSSDNKIHVKITAGSICTAIVSFIAGLGLGFSTANKFTLNPKQPPKAN